MNPALRRRSFLWWFTVVFFLAIGGPMIYHRLHKTHQRHSESRLAVAQIGSISEALEAYKNQYGNYPRPTGGSTDPVIQSKMLYQALTGDGTNFIDGVPPAPSDGEPATDGKLLFERAYSRFGGDEGLLRGGGEPYLIDPWGRPFHYVRGDEHNSTHNPRRFDLWSEGSYEKNPDEGSWITNWAP